MPLARATSVAIGSVVLWFCILTILHPQPILDERQHHGVIQRFANGDWQTPSELPMPPTYHAMVALAGKAFGSGLPTARAITAIMALWAIVLFSGTVRTLQPTPQGEALLHFAWLPVMFTFTAMAYTDAPAMFCIVASILLHVRRRFVWSAVMMGVACLIRQSNVVWVAFMAVWTLIDLWREEHDATQVRPRNKKSFLFKCAGKLWGHFIALALAAVFFIVNRGFTLGDVPQNHPRLNFGQFFVFALFVLLLWAPLWISRASEDTKALVRCLRSKPYMSVVILLSGAGFVTAMVVGFENPHPWNQSLSILRNWPLRMMADSLTARIFGSIALLITAAIVTRFTQDQPKRAMLTIVWLFALLFLLPHSLVEPRYYMIPACLVNLFARYSETQARSLVIWYLFLCVITSVGIFHGTIW